MNRLLAVDKPATDAGEWLMPPGLLPRFDSHRYPDTRSRYQIAWVVNACTRSINVECGKRQYQLIWTRKAYRR